MATNGKQGRGRGKQGRGRRLAAAAKSPAKSSRPKRQKASARQQTATSQRAAQQEQPSSSSKPILDSKDYPDLLSQDEIDKMEFSPENKKRLRQHCIAVATIVLKECYPDGQHKDFFSPLDFFKDNRCWNGICRLWQYCEMGARVREKMDVKNSGVEGLEAYFRKQFSVEISKFCDDINEQYEYEAVERRDWNKFVMRMAMYMFRSKQNWCVVKDCDNDMREHTMFGGAGYSDSDHALENKYDVIGVLKKKFGLDAHSLDEYRSWPCWLAEFAKICRTCCLHHQHDSSSDSCFSDLPTKCLKEYMLTDKSDSQVAKYSPVAPCLVQKSEQGKAVQFLTDHYCSMASEELERVTFDEITERYNKDAPFAFVDVHRQTETKWDNCTASQRKTSIRRTEITTEKSLCRCCFRCSRDIMNEPAKFKSGFHLHHMLECEKSHDPSKGVSKTIEEQRFENRKTILLCAGCHALITYNEEEKKKLGEKFESLGYCIVKETGEIRCTKEFDGIRVVVVI
eukprot:scaffold1993_cov147-Skeletonema_dohrnii-CCMP3373.AAC.4